MCRRAGRWTRTRSCRSATNLTGPAEFTGVNVVGVELHQSEGMNDLPKSRIAFAKRRKNKSDGSQSRDAWDLAKQVCIICCNLGQHKATMGAQRHPQSNLRTENFGDTGASMHMLCRKDFNSAELDTVRASGCPTPVIKANGSIETKEEVEGYLGVFGCS